MKENNLFLIVLTSFFVLTILISFQPFQSVNTTSTFKPQLPTQSSILPENFSKEPVFTTMTWKPQLPVEVK